MKNFRALIIFAMLSFTLWLPLTVQSGPHFRFSDNFETDQGWGIFEEIVGGSPCYGEEIGEVAHAPPMSQRRGPIACGCGRTGHCHPKAIM